MKLRIHGQYFYYRFVHMDWFIQIYTLTGEVSYV